MIELRDKAVFRRRSLGVCFHPLAPNARSVRLKLFAAAAIRQIASLISRQDDLVSHAFGRSQPAGHLQRRH